MKTERKIAFVIDALPSLGGAEKVLFTALEIFPQADIFTLVYNRPFFTNTPIANRSVKTSFIDNLPFSHKNHRLFLPVMPFAIEQFNLREYETIISFSYAVAHGVQNFNGARHISYTFTPMRYAWLDFNINGIQSPKNQVTNRLMQSFRQWDKKAASRVHRFVAISAAVSKRIKDAYQRDAEIIYPPVDVARFKPAQTRENFYITVTRLVPHKRVDIIVEAFSQLNLPLLVIGEGPELERLRQLANPNIQFLGYQPDEKVAELLGKARGFVCATEEDFGIAIVEAQAAGCPVIAYGKGGAVETVLEKRTGILFSEQTPRSLVDALQEFEQIYPCFQADNLVENSNNYQKENFVCRFKHLVEDGK